MQGTTVVGSKLFSNETWKLFMCSLDFSAQLVLSMVLIKMRLHGLRPTLLFSSEDTMGQILMNLETPGLVDGFRWRFLLKRVRDASCSIHVSLTTNELNHWWNGYIVGLPTLFMAITYLILPTVETVVTNHIIWTDVKHVGMGGAHIVMDKIRLQNGSERISMIIFTNWTWLLIILCLSSMIFECKITSLFIPCQVDPRSPDSFVQAILVIFWRTLGYPNIVVQKFYFSITRWVRMDQFTVLYKNIEFFATFIWTYTVFHDKINDRVQEMMINGVITEYRIVRGIYCFYIW
jgi:hypothetical protein